MRSYSPLSEDERDQIGVLRAAGRSMGTITRGSVGRSHHLPGVAAERTPFGRVLAASRRRSYQLRRRREALLEREAALRRFC
jgi:hypothetical protein